MFSCCKSDQSPIYYQVEKVDANQQPQLKYYSKVEDVDSALLNDPHTKITKVKRSLFEETHRQTQSNKQKFTDLEFPPNKKSLGNLPGFQQAEPTWKRISQLIKKPTLFDNKIEPRDVINVNVGDCYFLSSIAALAEDPKIIQNIFRGQSYNEQGIYKVSLRVNGIVEQVVIDDYIPLNQYGAPIFCQPNKTGQFWVLILEKALAKVNGSYANIIQGTPSQIFKAVTYAPSESIVFTDRPEQKQKIWHLINQYTQNHYPFCATTKQQIAVGVGLTPSHTYTVISAATIFDKNGHRYQVVRLRNPWQQVSWKGAANLQDDTFWSSIVDDADKRAFLQPTVAEYGIFVMLFDDFILYFNQIHYSNLSGSGKFQSQQLYANKKNASIFELEIAKEGTYTLELNQSPIFSLVLKQGKDEKLQQVSRSTIVLIKHQKAQNTQQKDKFTFVNGIMKYTELNTVLTQKLVPGHYLVYAKLDPTHSGKIPQATTLSLYSQNYSKLQPVRRDKYADLLKDTFLQQAQQNKKSFYNDNKMWISWKLLFQQGGFAYLALGNAQDSESAFIVTFDEDEFQRINFHLKKPYKGKGNGQVLKVNPGQQAILLARVTKDPITTVKFPPHLDIKIEPI